MNQPPSVAVAPFFAASIVEAVELGGARATPDPRDASGLIWEDPADPVGLKRTIAAADPDWVQLPFAGIEDFFAAGVIDEGRRWTCAKGIYGLTTAEHAIALMLAAARHLPEHFSSKRWRGGDFGAPERTLLGTTIVVVGTGGIGRALATLLAPWNVELLAVNRGGAPLSGASHTGTMAELGEMVGRGNFVVIAAALTRETVGLFDARMLSKMRSDAWLVNVARGGLVVTDDLVAALKGGSIAGAALDVTDPEPLPEGHVLWTLPNALITSHVANTRDLGLPLLVEMIRRNVRHYVAGEDLEGPVDVSLGY